MSWYRNMERLLDLIGRRKRFARGLLCDRRLRGIAEVAGAAYEGMERFHG